jgi:hypothetical protein
MVLAQLIENPPTKTSVDEIKKFLDRNFRPNTRVMLRVERSGWPAEKSQRALPPNEIGRQLLRFA